MLRATPKNLKETLIVAAKVEAFQASERQRHWTGELTTNMVETQEQGKQVTTLEISINEIREEVKTDWKE